MDEFITGIDIGTTKICAVTGQRLPDGQFHVAGMGVAASSGIRKGMIVDIERAAASIAEAAALAEKDSGAQIRGVLAGISGEHVSGINARGVAVVSDGRVKKADMDEALDNAEKMAVPPGREIIHAMPSAYTIDRQREIKDPLGMYAGHLEVDVHFVTAEINPFENFCATIKSAGYELENAVFQPLASVYSVLSDDDREMGAVLIDIGGGTTDVVIVDDGAVRFTGVIPLGGESVTNDISICLRASNAAAEKIKVQHGFASADSAPAKKISFPGGDCPVSARHVSEIIEARTEEILEMAYGAAKKSRLLPASGRGIVLTGGGALLPGIREKAEAFLDIPVRIGGPEGRAAGLERFGAGSAHSAAVGLLCLGLEENAKTSGGAPSGKGMLGGINKKMRIWFRDLI